MPDLMPSARNLLEGCAGMRAGERLLIVAEDAEDGFYGPGLAEGLAEAARAMGLRVAVQTHRFDPAAADRPEQLLARMAGHDRTLFLARVGDQLRFSPALADARPIVCYALDLAMMAGAFGRTEHAAMRALKALIDGALNAASEIRVTCPLGTDLAGAIPAPPEGDGDTTVTRFPLSVFTPVLAEGFSGRIAQAGFLVGTGSRYYTPYGIALEDVLSFRVEGRRIAGLDGRAADIAAARAHYQDTAARFDLDPWTVHSWHAGIHPGCAYDQPAGASLERWSGGAFGNPRLLHFHTCGMTPPGEISLNVVDPTVTLDGVALWETGVLRPERLAGGVDLLARHPGLATLLHAPSREIGLGPGGRLSYAPGSGT